MHDERKENKYIFYIFSFSTVFCILRLMSYVHVTHCDYETDVALQYRDERCMILYVRYSRYRTYDNITVRHCHKRHIVQLYKLRDLRFRPISTTCSTATVVLS